MQKEIDRLNKKVQEFRDEYVTATVSRRETIVLQVRALKIAIEKMEKKLARGQTKFL